MKNKKKKIALIVLLVVIIILMIIFIPKKFIPDYNILIFNPWKNISEESQISENQYIFDLENKNNASINIDLTDTSMYRKIQPGVNGKFDIIISGKNCTTNKYYQIQFTSKNEKPQNLTFNIQGENIKYSTIEELGKSLKGILEVGKEKTVVIEWEWAYESSEEGNFQDTVDGKNIQTYNFDINVVAEEVTY